MRYAPYVNPRFGFVVDRPLFLLPQRPPDNGDGREFRLGGIAMRVYAGWNIDGATASALLHDARRNVHGAQVVLAVAKRGWNAFSWSSKGIVHYEKSFVSRTKRTTVEFDYPAPERARMAPVVAHVVRSFQP